MSSKDDQARELLATRIDRDQTRAFRLLAEHAVDTATANAPVDVHEADLTGRHQAQQIGLLDAAATGLGGRLATHGDRTLVFGTAGHLHRVLLVFDALLPQMVDGATVFDRRSVAARKEWMRAYAHRIRDSLILAGQEVEAFAPSDVAATLADDNRRAHDAVDDFAATLGARVKRARAYKLHGGVTQIAV
ncbi:hypothetical protein [Rhodococcoides fascians]|uniref:hypothetical protein n=1 Tax=Rhodococcoides fascians TaxID=1828 RepID=UPI00055A1E2A|nr:hypothetical protein [Rhodococcus fascians]